MCIIFCQYTHQPRRTQTRTNIDIDGDLLAEAMRLSGLNTKRAVVEEALRQFVRLGRQGGIRELRGALRWEGDLEQSRLGRTGEPDPGAS